MMRVSKHYIVLFLLIALGSCKNDEPKPDTTISPEQRELSKLIKENPSDPSLRIDRARIYYNSQLYAAAISDVEKAIKIDSTVAEFYHFLSDIHMDAYHSKECIDALLDARTRFPDNIVTHLKLAEDYLILTESEKAMRSANDVLKLDPQNAEGFFMVGMIFRAMDEKKKAIGALQDAIQIDPDLYDAWIIIGQLYEDLGEPIAMQYYDGAIEVSPENVTGWHSKAYYLQNNGQVDEALKLYKRINLIDRQFEEAYLNAGLLYLDKDSISKAYEQFNILVNVAPQSYQGYYFRGISNELLGKKEFAKQDYEVALRLNQNFSKARQALQALNS